MIDDYSKLCIPYKLSSQASSRISIPNSCAFWSLLPASTPATTRSVFFETLPVTLAPRLSSLFLASERFKRSSLPVKTTVRPDMTASAATTCPL